MEESEDYIAVIGIGCSFPGGEGVEHFWRVLLEGKNCTREIPPERFDSKYWYDTDEGKPGKTQTRKAAFIDGFNKFDHKCFGIPEAEANDMDPQQKLLLHCTYRALEDAGISMESISGNRTGVIIGVMNRDYETFKSDDFSTINHYNATGTAMSIAANRISFVFNLTGPSFAIDSACSSSLVALHLACQSLKQGECEMAVCGGVSCIIEPRVFVALSKAKMLSPEGISKPFSSKADGYGRGEGCGVVLLKPLKNAIRDLNKIWGIVSKTALNQDGRHISPITKPSMLQQEELLRQIYSEIDVANVQYIEAHGTGTAIGDQTEAGSISKVIAKSKPATEMLKIGSVKGNIGHTESAAGVAGLIKVLLMMKHETIVPTLFYSEDNACIDTKALRLNIVTKVERWEANRCSERVAGINSFGFGGTNAHAIVKEYKQKSIPSQVGKKCPKVFVVSAATEELLQVSISDIQQKFCSNSGIDLQALSYTLACGRSHLRHKYRKAFLASSIFELQPQLACALTTKVEQTKSDIQVAFVFCGNGVAYRGMCKQLLKDEPVFREKISEVEEAFNKYKHINIRQKLLDDHAEDDFRRPDVVQPLLFAVQVGIVTLLKQWGIKPDVVLGHSVGEVAAAHCSGLLSLEDAVKVLHHRSALQSRVVGGKMLVVCNVPVKDTLKSIAEFKDGICVAAYNSPQSCTLSGEEDAIVLLHQKLRLMFADRKAFLSVLDVPAAYHSPKMQPILNEIENNIQYLDAKNMECQLFSTVMGKQYSDGDFCTGSYWAKNVRQPVLFEQTLHAVTQDRRTSQNVVFVEISPRKALQRNIHETLGGNHIVLSSVQPDEDRHTILFTVAKLFELGVNVNWHKVYKGYETIPIEVPVHQFETRNNEICFERLRKGHQLTCSSHPLIGPNEHNMYICNLSLATTATAYLWEHKSNSVPIVPAALYVELAYASIIASIKPKKPASSLQLSIDFDSLCTLNSDYQQLKVTINQAGKQCTFNIDSSASTHASGSYSWSEGHSLVEEPFICLDVISQRCTSVMKSDNIYSILNQAGFEYGTVFKQLHLVYFGDEYREVMAPVQVPEELLKGLHEYFIHPVLLDCFLQMTAVVSMQQLSPKQGFPSAIGSIVMTGPLHKQMILYLRVSQDTPDFLEVCGCLTNTEGKVLVELTGVKISFINPCAMVLQSLFFHSEILSVAAEQFSVSKIKGILFEDKFGLANALRPYLDIESIAVEQGPQWTSSKIRDLIFTSKNVLKDVIFMCSIEDLSHMTSEKNLEVLVNCCMQFQQIVLALKEFSCTVRVVTYRSTGETVNYISPGFVLHGLTRACAAELPGLTFQLIDLESVTNDDIDALVYALNTCTQQEVMIKKGQISTTRIVHTPIMDKCAYSNNAHAAHLDFSLWTCDPYKMANLSACPSVTSVSLDLHSGLVEVELTNICVHSANYFPVSTSQLQFGQTLYWNKHATQNHKLLALDFCGVVTAIGKNVSKLKVGDYIASCYPVVSSAKVRIPEAACYCTRRLPYLMEMPCVSFYVLAWEILQRHLAEVKQECRKLALISSNPASVLMKVLALTANRSGWNVSSWSYFSAEHLDLDKTNALVFLPPFDHSLIKGLDLTMEETHFVFVDNSYMSTPSSLNHFAAKHDNIYVHRVDVADVFQKPKLQAQNKNISNWLISLGFARESLPLKREAIQTKESKEQNENVESYFTTKTVKQIVLSHRSSDCLVSNIPVLAKPRQLFNQHCVYIVTGGLSGLGWETVKFIAENGGGCIVTLSRSCPSSKIQIAIEELHKRFNIEVLNLQCDVSLSVQVKDAMIKIQQRFPSCPVKGVFHSAVVLHDGRIECLERSLFEKVLRPKVCGALNLHFATLHYKLDYFVCFSSVSSLIGNASQCNYAAANSFLDAFCQYRRNLGLVGQSINWGPLNLGLLLNKDHFHKFLETKGFMLLDVSEVHNALKTCILEDRVQQIICKFNFKNLHRHVLSQNVFLRKRLSALVQTELKNELASETSVSLIASTQKSVKKIVSDLINVSEDELNDFSALCALGIDSMLAMTLQNKIFQETGINVSLVKILDHNCTLATLITAVVNR